MGCVKLLQGLDLTCASISTRYFQNIVLVNREDVAQKLIVDSGELHRISFNLREGASGYMFIGNDNGSLLSASFSKTSDRGIPYYNHSVQFPISGTSERIKSLLKQLDNGDLFAAIQMRNGDIEIYGFDNGLVSTDYTYEAQSALGGSVIELSSRYDEYDPPYIFFSGGDETLHFDNKFVGIGEVLRGDFNNDFNDDFYIGHD